MQSLQEWMIHGTCSPMKSMYRRFPFVAALLFLPVIMALMGCPSAPFGNCVEFTNLGGVAGPPSVVNVFFRLTTCNGQPLAGITADEYLIRENGREVSIFESQQQYITRPRCSTSATVCSASSFTRR